MDEKSYMLLRNKCFHYWKYMVPDDHMNPITFCSSTGDLPALSSHAQLQHQQIKEHTDSSLQLQDYLEL